jgi:DNA-binding beta-propeller fold protein YncE
MIRIPLFACLWLGIVTLLQADQVVLVAGGGKEPDKVPAKDAKLVTPFGVDFDREGNLYFIELKGERVGKIDPKGILTIIAGTGKRGSGGDGGPAEKAEFNGMHHLALTPNGDIYLADTWNNKVRKIDAKTGHISTFAGTGQKGFSGDGGPASEAKFGGIYCLAFDSKFEKMFLVDLDNRRVRAIDMKTNMVSTIAGNGQKGIPEDGSEAKQSSLVDPRAVAVDRDGNIYILERSGHALRVVDAQGKIRTVVGTGKQGSPGDGEDARKATLNGPKHLCIDQDGGVIIADTENHLIRKYLPKEGKIIRLAGTGKKGKSGIGESPEKLELNQPHGVWIHPQGNLYISDSTNDRILMIKK